MLQICNVCVCVCVLWASFGVVLAGVDIFCTKGRFYLPARVLKPDTRTQQCVPPHSPSPHQTPVTQGRSVAEYPLLHGATKRSNSDSKLVYLGLKGKCEK